MFTASVTPEATLAARRLAVLGAVAQVGGVGVIASLRVDGERVDNLAAYTEASRQSFAAFLIALEHGHGAARPAGRGVWAASGRAVHRMLDWMSRVQLAHARASGPLGFLVRVLLGPLLAHGLDVIRCVKVELVLTSGERFNLTAQVLDVPRTLRVRRVDEIMTVIGAAPVPVPIVGSLYGIVSSAIAALVALALALWAMRQGDVAVARAYRTSVVRQLWLTLHSALPAWSTATQLYAVWQGYERLRELRRFANVEDVVRFGPRVYSLAPREDDVPTKRPA